MPLIDGITIGWIREAERTIQHTHWVDSLKSGSMCLQVFDTFARIPKALAARSDGRLALAVALSSLQATLSASVAASVVLLKSLLSSNLWP